MVKEPTRDWGGDQREGRGCRRRVVLVAAQVSSQRSLQTALRSASRGLTLARSQCMPAPLRRASTTSLFALSTTPLPMGHPFAWKVGYCSWASRLSS